MSCTRVVPHQLVSGRYGFRLACLVVLYLGITSGANATVIPIDLTNFFTADLPAVVVTDSGRVWSTNTYRGDIGTSYFVTKQQTWACVYSFKFLTNGFG